MRLRAASNSFGGVFRDFLMKRCGVDSGLPFFPMVPKHQLGIFLTPGKIFLIVQPQKLFHGVDL
jgi:hypothetical protein